MAQGVTEMKPEFIKVNFGALQLDFDDCPDGEVDLVDENGELFRVEITEFIAAAEWLKTKDK